MGKAAFGRPFLFSEAKTGTIARRAYIRFMNLRTQSTVIAHGGRALAAMALLACLAVPAAAQQQLPVARDNATEIIQLQNRIQRQQFEQQQQLNRQIDRQQVTQPPAPRPQVPTFRQNCQITLSGNTYVRNCR